MALPKVVGTETEFGITVQNQSEFNPVLASSTVINAYRGGRARIQWSFDEESPGRDARGFGYEESFPIELETGLVNVVLTNGARLYVDHAHPEYSTPECSDPLQAALYDKAGERIMAHAVLSARAMMPEEQRMFVHKNNSDGKGNSYGAHENYLIARRIPFGSLVQHFTGFLATRQMFTGSGKLGSENGRDAVDFQMTQRADFFEEEVGLETTLKRPIINTRDEPHADASKYRRLHVIIGDATMAEPQTLLKLGSAMLMLDAIEDEALPEPLLLADPVNSVWKISHDLTLRQPLELDTGGTITPLEAQWQYLQWLTKYVASSDRHGPVYASVLELWESVLTGLEDDPLTQADRLDWVAKYQLFLSYMERDGLTWDDPKLKLLDLQYHDVDPDKGLYNRLARSGRMQTLFTDDEVAEAASVPPADTRAYFRGECVSRFGEALVAANWDSLVFDTGESSLKRVPMMEPLRGTKALLGEILESSKDAADLLQALGGDDD